MQRSCLRNVRHITGYRVKNSLLVTSAKLALAGDIISSATAAGANHVNAVSFGLAEPRRHRQAAIELATANAQSDARSLAAAAGQTLVKIVSLNLDHSDASPVRMRNSDGIRSAMAEGIAPPLQAGDVTVRASVSIRYLIE